MHAKPLWAVMETPDGVFIPGPHGTSAASRIYPGISSGVALIANGGEALIVDPGCRTIPEYPAGVLDTICTILDQRRLRLKYLVQTHWHFDHTGNTRYLREHYGGEVVCHPKDRPVIEDPLLLCRPEYIRSCGGDPAEIAADLNLPGPAWVLAPEEAMRRYFNYPIAVDRTVEDGEVLWVGELPIQVVHTPGHTPGHLSLYSPRSGSLYLADVMHWPSPLLPHPVGTVDEQIASIQKCLALRADYLFPGHDLPRCGTYDVEDYLKDLLLKHAQLERRILVLLSRFGPLTITELHAESFVLKDRYDYPFTITDGRGQTREGWYTNSLNCVHAHVRRLLEQRKVARIPRGDGQIAWAATGEGRLSSAEVAVAGSYERAVQAEMG